MISLLEIELFPLCLCVSNVVGVAVDSQMARLGDGL